MQYYVYLLGNHERGTFYVGVTNDLQRRMAEHKQCLIKGFTAKYKIDLLFYYEVFEDVELAITREKQLKRYKRHYKYNLIEKNNADWQDLAAGWLDWSYLNTNKKLVASPDPGTCPG